MSLCIFCMFFFFLIYNLLICTAVTLCSTISNGLHFVSYPKPNPSQILPTPTICKTVHHIFTSLKLQKYGNILEIKVIRKSTLNMILLLWIPHERMTKLNRIFFLRRVNYRTPYTPVSAHGKQTRHFCLEAI